MDEATAALGRLGGARWAARLAEPGRRLLARAQGRVLDLGLAFDHLDDYRAAGDLDGVVALDAERRSVEGLSRRAAALGLALEVVADPLDRLASGGERFDTVVSFFALPLYADLPATLHAVGRVLAPGGRLLLLEPVLSYHPLGRALRAFTPLLRATAGLHLEREVPSAVREAGFTITDLERITMPTLLWPVRRFVSGRAALVSGPAPAGGRAGG